MSFYAGLLLCLGCWLLLVSGSLWVVWRLLTAAREEYAAEPDPGGEWTAERERRFMVWALREARHVQYPASRRGRK